MLMQMLMLAIVIAVRSEGERLRLQRSVVRSHLVMLSAK